MQPQSQAMQSQSSAVVQLLRSRGLTVATGESLTGGLIVASLIDVPGASTVVRGGTVAYMTDVKSLLLDVSPELIARVGTVDPAIAIALAHGARRAFGADVGVGSTGVAGPGPHEGKPAGTVHVAAVWGDDDPDAVVDAPELRGGRWEIRQGAVRAALSVLRARLEA